MVAGFTYYDAESDSWWRPEDWARHLNYLKTGSYLYPGEVNTCTTQTGGKTSTANITPVKPSEPDGCADTIYGRQCPALPGGRIINSEYGVIDTSYDNPWDIRDETGGISANVGLIRTNMINAAKRCQKYTQSTAIPQSMLDQYCDKENAAKLLAADAEAAKQEEWVRSHRGCTGGVPVYVDPLSTPSTTAITNTTQNVAPSIGITSTEDIENADTVIEQKPADDKQIVTAAVIVLFAIILIFKFIVKR